jgi:hypothetical protein
MKFYYLALIFVLFSLSLFCQAVWDEDGVAVRNGDYIYWETAAVSYGDDMIYVWTDCRRGDRDIWAQKIDSEGNKLWDEDALICGVFNCQGDPVIIDAGDNCVIIAWVDFRNEYTGDIYAQKLNTDGELLWGPSGVPICLTTDYQASLNIVNDTTGGAYIIWSDGRGTEGAVIYGTHILSNGDIATGWETNGNPITSAAGSQYQHNICEDGSGGIVLVWRSYLYGEYDDLYMQRVLTDGTHGWDENGILLCGAIGVQSDPEIVKGYDQICTITWLDRRNDTEGDIYLQRISLDGQILLENDLCVCDAANNQRDPKIVATSDNGAIVVWKDERNNNNYVFYVQKIDQNGTPIWDTNGLLLQSCQLYAVNADIIADDTGGAWLTLLEGSYGANLYIQHIDLNGNLLIPDNIVYTGFINNDPPRIVGNTSYFSVIWSDFRSGSDELYLQNVDNTGNLLLPVNGQLLQHGISGDASDQILLANGDNPIVIWRDRRNIASKIFMQVLNPDGTTVFIEDGIPITSDSGWDQINPEAVYNPDSDIVAVVWEELGDSYTNIVYAQAVDTDGNLIWSDDGLLVCPAVTSLEQYRPQISFKEEYGNYDYYVGWQDYRDLFSCDLYAQKIRNGELQWDEEGVLIADQQYDIYFNDIVEDFFIYTGGVWPDPNLYVKRIDSNGNVATGWPDDGLEVCNENGFQLNAQGSLTSYGLLIIWEDRRSGVKEIYGQLITPEGEILWQENGLPLATGYEDLENLFSVYDDDNFYLTWEVWEGNYNNIYLQRYNYSGIPCWTNTVEIGMGDVEKNDPNPVLCEDKIFVTWSEDSIDPYSYDKIIKAQLITDTGELLWPMEGESVCESIKYRENPQAVFNGNDYVYCVWSDGRANDYCVTDDLYAQKMNISETGISENNVVDHSDNILTNYPNPFNPETAISFSIQEESKINLSIYNIKGQLVKVLINNYQNAGEHSIIWDGRDSSGNRVSSGIYLYKLNVNDKTKTVKKCLLLK